LSCRTQHTHKSLGTYCSLGLAIAALLTPLQANAQQQALAFFLDFPKPASNHPSSYLFCFSQISTRHGLLLNE
jgi:hypothetical protein